MDKESANWCRLAYLIKNKGGEVLRQFLLLEILTRSLNISCNFWMKNVHNPAKINFVSLLFCKFIVIHQKSHNPILNNLIKSWKPVTGDGIAIKDQIRLLKQWKNDIENEKKSVSSCIGSTLDEWLLLIEHEIENMMQICTVSSQLNNTFHRHLQNAQSELLLEIEKNDGFLTSCSHKLRSLSKPSRCEFQELVQTFKQELNSWKGNCCEIFQEFHIACSNIITPGVQANESVPKSYVMNTFFHRFQNSIEDFNLESQVDDFCDKWDDDLHIVFTRYEKQVQEGDSTEVILCLAQSMCEELEKFSSFKEKKIRDFFRSFSRLKLFKYFKIQCSNLQNVSRPSDLNEFDLNILMNIWKNGNFVHSPQHDWMQDPDDGDTSVSADILRLHKYQRNIVASIAQCRISSEIFEQFWNEIGTLLRNIASRCGDEFSMNISWEIDQMKECSLEPHREYQLRREFLMRCKNDIFAPLSTGYTADPHCLGKLQSIEKALENLYGRRQACTCHICSMDISTESELAQHMQLHQDFRCLSCNMTFSTGNDLTNHMMRHRGRACRKCKMVCSKEMEFRQHVYLNLDCRCPSCDGAIRTESVFMEHITYHQYPFCCLCHKEFYTELDFDQHMLSHQARSCLSCRKEFLTEDEIEQHMRCHQARTCRSCNKNFSTAIELEEHIRNHEDRTCRICQQELSTDNELAEHVRKHLEDHKAPDILTKSERNKPDIDATSNWIEQSIVNKDQSSVETEMHPSEYVTENPEDNIKDLEDGYEFFEAIRNNDQKVNEMIRNQRIPKQSIMAVAMKQVIYSSGVQRALIEMSTLLREVIAEAVGVWCGYRPEDPHNPVFVITLKDKKCILRKEDIPEPFVDYTVITRYKYVPNDEERSIEEQYGSSSVRSDDVARVNNCIAKNTENLMKKHTNLSIIRPCAIKSCGYVNKNMKVTNETCIVFYVPVKGVIPVGENEFPKMIDGIVTDVREGEFLLYAGHNATVYHPKLRIGCSISSGSNIGSLGGFVDLAGEKIGCLTAAHSVLTPDEIQQCLLKKKIGNQIDVHQPKPLLEYKPFGKVQNIALEEGNIFTPSVDAAVIEITDDDRKPDTGRFPDGDYENYGLTKEHPLFYTSGAILDDIKSHTNGSLAIKFGCATGLTHGWLQCTEKSVREVDVWGGYIFPVMFRQLEVSQHEFDFANQGDSGALVFLCVDGNIRNLRAAGMVIGGSSTRNSCVITPIQAVLEKLGLTSNKLKVFPDSQLSQVIKRIDDQGREQLKHNEILDQLSQEVNLIKQKVTTVDVIEAKVDSLEQNVTEGFKRMMELLVQNKMSDKSSNT